MTGGNTGERGEVGGNVRRGRGGKGGGELAEVFAVEVTVEALEL